VSDCCQSDPVQRVLNLASDDLKCSPLGWESLPLAGDGSDRRFFRVRQGSRHFVVLVAPRKNASGLDENDSYWLIGNHLRACGVPVPEILWADKEAGHFVLQDVGDWHLQRFVEGCRSREQVRRAYRRALKVLVQLLRRAPHGFSSSFCFDTSIYDAAFVYQRELEYFRSAFLVGFLGLDIDADELRADFQKLAATAATTRPGLVMHRDFQSRNLMVHQGRLWVIDFQGMRFGPPTYDLAALIVDPYVTLPKGLQDELVDLYWSAAGRVLGGNYRTFRDHFQAVRLCRNLQALGAYSFLGKVKGKTGFFQYIPGAWRQLRELLKGPLINEFPNLAELVKYVGDVRTTSQA
jgi:N-acetylmuramate 1-kinase